MAYDAGRKKGMREKYLRFIAIMGDLFSGPFGKAWSYSALCEKNVYRFRSYHTLSKGLKPEGRLFALKSPLLALRRWLSFAGEKVFSGGRKDSRNAPPKYIVVSYSNPVLFNLFSPDEVVWIVLPQKGEGKIRDAERIGAFIGWFDLAKIAVLYFFQAIPFLFWWFPFRIRFRAVSRNAFGLDVWPHFREEIWRSFLGDVLVSGIYYDFAFRNMARKYPDQKIFYQYEGYAWEKGLCLNFGRERMTGVLFHAVSPNVLNCFCGMGEPLPGRLAVPGRKMEALFADAFGDRVDVFILGDVYRRHYLVGVKEDKADFIAVILGGIDREAQELINWMDDRKWDRSLVVISHPDNRKVWVPEEMAIDEVDGWNYFDCLLKAKMSVATLSSLSVEAAALGACVMVPELPSFVDLCPLRPEHRGRVNDRAEILKGYMEQVPTDEMRKRLIGESL